MAHAKLSPSSAHQWLNCPLSIKMRERYSHLDPNRYSVPAAQGTIKHAVIENCLRTGIDPYRFVGLELRLGDYREGDEDMPQEWADYIYEFTEDDADTLMDALDEIDDFKGEQHIEYRVNLSKYCGKDQFGTLDLGMIIPLDDGWVDVLIWDNKFGRVPVSAVENSQLCLYGLGFYENVVKPRQELEKFRIRKFIIRIWQPYVKGAGGEWEISLKDMLKFAEYVKPRAKLALATNPKANPGPEQCEWCIGSKLGKCEPNIEYNKKIMKAMFAEGEDLDDLVETDQMPCLKFNGVDPVMRSWILDNFAMFSKFVDRLENEAFEDAYYGRPVPGKKLVKGHRPRRKYRNTETAVPIIVARLGDEKSFTKKLLSPAQLEKAVGHKNMGEFAELIEQGEAKLVLVNQYDSRAGVKSIREMFED